MRMKQFRRKESFMEKTINERLFEQLMRAPQILAYIAQLDFWFREYNVEIV